jgi:hypothetical protein
MDHVLDLVAAAQVHATLAQILDRGLVAVRLALATRGLAGLFAAFELLGDVGIYPAIVLEALDIVLVVTLFVVRVIVGAQGCLLGGMLGLFAEQRVAVFFGDLVVIGVDLAEGEEAVASDGSTRVTLAR